MLVVNVLKWYFAQINRRVEVDILYWFRRLVSRCICRFSIIFGVSLSSWRSVIAAALCVAQELELIDNDFFADEITRDQAIDLLRKMEPTRAQRIAYLEEHGYPCYSQ